MKRLSLIAVIAACAFFPACAGGPFAVTCAVDNSGIVTGSETVHGPKTLFADPFTYCAAVGTIDAPEERYTGPKVPESIVAGLRKIFGSPDSTPQELMERGTFWRCMDGKVWACFVGANLPCKTKADKNRTPSRAMEEFCTTNPADEGMPAYVTGRATVYQWRCREGSPEIIRQLVDADAQGFLSSIWFEIRRK